MKRFDAEEVYQRGLEARFYFLKERKKGICPECQKEKLVIPDFSMCLECMATKKAWNICETGGDLTKPYVRAVLNDGYIRPEALTIDLVASLWEDIKSDYYRNYLKRVEEKKDE